MNIWLHKQVIKKLAANGGKVPANLAGFERLPAGVRRC